MNEPQDLEFDVSLRPSGLNEYVGQPVLKRNLAVYISAARQRQSALDHVLLYGPPGLGKTTMAHIIAAEMGASMRSTSGPAIERPGDLAAILTNLQPLDVLFIDEIHRLSASVEEVLYPAMEDYQLDIIIGQGPSARTVKIDLPPFTLVGATTRAGLLTTPLRDRFGVVHKLEFYAPEDLVLILKRAARILRVELRGDGANMIASRSRGTPRVANNLLKRCRDFAEVHGEGAITQAMAEIGLEAMGVDEIGLDETHRQLLKCIIHKFGGGPVGRSTISAALGEEKDTIEDVTEPYLIQLGLLERTPRGRKATPRAYQHLGLNTNQNQDSLFSHD